MDGKKFIQTIRLQNLLSYGPDTPKFDLEPLNVLIGPNASGKSNLIEALSILAAAPRDIQVPFREGGSVGEWLWKGSQDPFRTATVEVTVNTIFGQQTPLRYRLSFSEIFGGFTLDDEVVEDEHPSEPGGTPRFYYQYRSGQSVVRVDGEATSERQLERKDLESGQSILSQLRLPGLSLGIAVGVVHLTVTFNQFRFYREFPLGRNAPARLPQQADLPQEYLAEDASNLAVVLSYLQNQPQTRELIQRHMQEFYPSVSHIHPRVLGGTVQVFFEEEELNANVPATRLSDGSLRYLCLLVALSHPDPPPVICIEEPETGLHPDVIPQLAKLLVAASQRSQIVVTTHSDILVDALSETPEAVVICEKVNGATQLRRLDPDDLKVWLEKYRLGELWTSGDLGGNLY